MDVPVMGEKAMEAETPSKALAMWVIYDHPQDYPDWFVARKCLVQHGGVATTSDVKLARQLEALRRVMESMGLTMLDRFPGDDPVIVEVWL